MDKLGAFDQFFYKAEQYQVASLVMGGVSILEPARPRDPLDAGAIAEHLAARLQNIPLLRDALAEAAERLYVKTPRFLLHNTAPLLSALGNGTRELFANNDDAVSDPKLFVEGVERGLLELRKALPVGVKPQTRKPPRRQPKVSGHKAGVQRSHV